MLFFIKKQLNEQIKNYLRIFEANLKNECSSVCLLVLFFSFEAGWYKGKIMRRCSLSIPDPST